MADTVITNTPGVTRGSDDGANAIGWALALILILAALVAGFFYLRRNGIPAPSSTNINVTVPSNSGGTDSTGGTDTSGGGTTY